MTQEQLERYAFLAGYAHSLHLPAQSMRDVQERFPDWNDGQIANYLNGLEDGHRGDSWRYQQLTAHLDWWAISH